MGVVSRLPDNGYSRTNGDTARLVRDLADKIEAGDFGHVDTFVGVIEHDGLMSRVTYGDACDRARLTGLLTMAVHRLACASSAED